MDAFFRSRQRSALAGRNLGGLRGFSRDPAFVPATRYSERQQASPLAAASPTDGGARTLEEGQQALFAGGRNAAAMGLPWDAIGPGMDSDRTAGDSLSDTRMTVTPTQMAALGARESMGLGDLALSGAKKVAGGLLNPGKAVARGVLGMAETAYDNFNTAGELQNAADLTEGQWGDVLSGRPASYGDLVSAVNAIDSVLARSGVRPEDTKLGQFSALAKRSYPDVFGGELPAIGITQNPNFDMTNISFAPEDINIPEGTPPPMPGVDLLSSEYLDVVPGEDRRTEGRFLAGAESIGTRIQRMIADSFGVRYPGMSGYGNTFFDGGGPLSRFAGDVAGGSGDGGSFVGSDTDRSGFRAGMGDSGPSFYGGPGTGGGFSKGMSGGSLLGGGLGRGSSVGDIKA
jgi:hypothetical protein